MPSNDSPQEHWSNDVLQWRVWLGAIVLLGAALRLYNLAHESIWFDEGVGFYLSRYLDDLPKYFDPEYSNDGPLHSILIGLWYRGVLALPGVVQGSYLCDFLLRLYPALIGIASIPLTYLAGRIVTRNRAAALSASFLMAISPFQIFYSQDLRAYPLHVLINLAALCLMVKALRENRPHYWIGLVLVLSAGVYNHFYMVWCIVAINVYFTLTLKKHWPRLLPWIAANLAVILLVVPALRSALYVSHMFDTAWETWYPTPSPAIALITFKTFFAGYSESQYAYKALTLLALGATLLGAFALRKNLNVLILYITLAFTPIVTGLIYWSIKDFAYFTYRLQLFSAVPVYLLIGSGIVYLRWRVVTVVTLSAFAILTLPALADHYAQRLHPAQTHTIGNLYKPDNRGAAAYIKAHLEPGDLIVHRARYTYMPFIYYIDTPQHVVELTERGIVNAMIGYPSIRSYETYGTKPKLLTSLLGDATRVWLINSWWNPFDHEIGKASLAAWLDAHAVRESHQAFDGVEVIEYQILPPDEFAHRYVLADNGHTTLNMYLRDSADDAKLFSVSASDPLNAYRTILEESSLYSMAFDLQATDGSAEAKFLDKPFSEVRSDSSKTFAVSIPITREVSSGYAYVLANSSPSSLSIDIEEITGTAIFDAMSFDHRSPRSSIWIPQFRQPLKEGRPIGTAPTLVASLSKNAEGGAMLTKRFHIEPGDYRIWLNCAVTSTGSSIDGARVTVSIVDPDNGKVHYESAPIPSATLERDGWQWLQAGTFASERSELELQLAVFNSEHLDAAKFHLQEVVLTNADQSDPPAIVRTLQLEPSTEVEMKRSLPTGSIGPQETLLRSIHAPSGQTRQIRFFTEGSR